NQKETPCLVTIEDRDVVRVDFDDPQRAPTPGQAVVFYDADTVLGGGTLLE
ncbi:MAG: tRNA 2-thiouridine(34) synthase MnmA, partial [Clostridia bacterium]|nr:tRNA 2-thiouridine(34) synthase MnmA [Clostridia bacterium]